MNKTEEVKNMTKKLLELSECLDCGYIGTVGKWVGNAYVSNDKEDTKVGAQVPISGFVHPDGSGNFNLDPLIHDIEKDESNSVDNFDGEAFCPICNSFKFYDLNEKIELEDKFIYISCKKRGFI